MKPDPLDEVIAAARGAAPEDAPPAETTGEPAVVAEPEIELPKHWSEEDRAKWGAVPAEHRSLLVDVRKSIEAGADSKFKAAAEPRKNWKAFKEIMAPLQPLLSQHGATKLQTVRNLVGNYVGLVQQPDAAFEHLARSFAASRSEGERQAILTRFARGLGLSQGAPKAQASEEYLDPVAGQKIARLEQALQNIGQSIQQTALTEKQRAIAQAEQVIQTFAAANPHFNEVRADVEILLGSSKVPAHLPASERLAKAYEIACRMNPEVWEKIDAAKKAEKAKADAEKRKAEVEKAKVAARNPQGQFVAATGGGGKLKLDEIIKEEAGRRSAA